MFDVQAAIKAGANEDQVIDYLNRSRGGSFDVQGALSKGASKQQIIQYLSSKQVQQVDQQQQDQQPQKKGVGQIIKEGTVQGLKDFGGAVKNIFYDAPKTIIDAGVVRNATRIGEASIAPASINIANSSTNTRNQILDSQQQLMETLKRETNPAKKENLRKELLKNFDELVKLESQGSSAIDMLGDRNVRVPGLGDFQEPTQKGGFEGGKQIVGQTLKNASVIAGPTSAMGVTAAGGAYGLGQSLEDNSSLKDTVINTATGALTALAGVKTLPWLANKVGNKTIPEYVSEVRQQRLQKKQNNLVQNQIKSMDKVIDDTVNQSLRPSTSGKKTITRVQGYAEQTRDAVKTVVENRDLLNLTDAQGVPVENALPEDLFQTAQAVKQTKDIIFSKYNSLAEKATGEGVRFDAKPVLQMMAKQADDLGNPPQVREYIKSLMKEVAELDGVTADVVQSRIQNYNTSSNVQSYFAGRTESAKAAADVSLAGLMRKQLDDMIETAGGPGYQELRTQYRNLKTLEADVNKRLVVASRKAPKGFFDLPDIFGSGDVISGLVTANPTLLAKGIAVKGLSAWAKQLNDPNRMIAKMFNQLGDTFDAAQALGIEIRPPIKAPSVDPLKKYLSTVEKGKTYTETIVPQKLEPFSPNPNKPIKVNNYQSLFSKYLTPDQIRRATARLRAIENSGKTIDMKTINEVVKKIRSMSDIKKPSTPIKRTSIK